MFIKILVEIIKLNGSNEFFMWFVIYWIFGNTSFSSLQMGRCMKSIVASLSICNWSRLFAGYLSEKGKKKPILSGMSNFDFLYFLFKISKYWWQLTLNKVMTRSLTVHPNIFENSFSFSIVMVLDTANFFLPCNFLLNFIIAFCSFGALKIIMVAHMYKIGDNSQTKN